MNVLLRGDGELSNSPTPVTSDRVSQPSFLVASRYVSPDIERRRWGSERGWGMESVVVSPSVAISRNSLALFASPAAREACEHGVDLIRPIT